MQILEHKIPPPAVTLLFAILMWLLSTVESSLALAVPWRTTVAILLWSAGVMIALAGLLEFRRAKTTINPLNPEAATAVVSSGIYRFSRNPMYLGLLLVLIGWAVWLSNVLAYAPIPFFVLYINRFQIEPEERVLTAKFGGQFKEYTRSVRRWV